MLLPALLPQPADVPLRVDDRRVRPDARNRRLGSATVAPSRVAAWIAASMLGTMPNPEEPNNPLGDVAGMWHADTQAWESLGYLSSAGYCPGRSSGYELSADGSVAVGLSWDGCNGLAVRWTQATGMVALEELAFGGNRASVVSADGSVIAGFAQGSQSRTPAVWYANGAGEPLDPSASAVGEIHGISDDGTILLGEWTTNEATTRATKWTLGPGGWEREQIANGSILPGWGGIPEDIADDGTIVGFDFLLGYRRAWIVPPGSASVLEFKPYIEAHGATVPSGMTLEVCQAISRDGRFIVGHGFGGAVVRMIQTGMVAVPATVGERGPAEGPAECPPGRSRVLPGELSS